MGIMRDWPSFRLPAPLHSVGGGPTLAGFTLNASGDRAGFVVICPKAGTLDKFEFRSGTVSNTPDNGMRLSFQDVDLATGNPDGTPDQFRDITSGLTANTWLAPGLMTSDGTDTGTKRTVAAGEHLCCVVDFVTFVAADSFQVSHMDNLAGLLGELSRNQYSVDGSTGTYSKNNSGLPILALKYNDGSYAKFDLPIWPVLAVDAIAFNSGSTPDERALKILRLPQSVRTIGAWVVGDIDGPCDVVLYDASSTAIDSFSLDPDVRNAATAATHYGLWPNGPHTLSAEAVYRVSVRPSSVTNLNVSTYQLPGTDYWSAYPGGSDWILSTRADAGVWTDDNTRRPHIGLICNGIDATHRAALPQADWS